MATTRKRTNTKKRRPSVREELGRMDDVVIECRANNHPWVWTDFTLNGGPGIKVHKVCPRCETEADEVWSRRTFEVISSRPKYREGYLSEGGRIFKPDSRGEVLRRKGFVS